MNRTDCHRLILQFHITGRCNLRCRHCYRAEGDVEPLTLKDVTEVLEQYRGLLAYYNRQKGIRRRGHVNITGGEPFIRSDIAEILSFLGSNRELYSYGVLSNGSFITDGMTALLRQTGVSFVQLSLDGDRAAHDSLRTPGDYDRVLDTARRLEREGIRTYISFTANRENYRHLPEAAKECRKRKISKLWSDRVVPIGGGEELSGLTIGPEDMDDYLRALRKARGSRLTRILHPGTEVSLGRALQFIDSGGDVYSCGAGSSLITVDEFGRVMPCRRMPIYCGDIFSSTLTEIYRDHPVFTDLRKALIPKECASCVYSHYCRGGARCQSYAAGGSYNRADPACPLASRCSGTQKQQ